MELDLSNRELREQVQRISSKLKPIDADCPPLQSVAVVVFDVDSAVALGCAMVPLSEVIGHPRLVYSRLGRVASNRSFGPPFGSP